MSAIELKERIRSQVDLLTEEQDLEDLYETICLFFENRQVTVSYSDEFLEDTQRRMQDAQNGNVKGITTQELKEKMKEWLTK